MASSLYPTASSIKSTAVAPEIQSVGLPHSIHADRIIGLMLQHMAKRQAELWAGIDAILDDPYCRDGNPRAQAKLEAKIRKLGALRTSLTPGKRGRYEMFIYTLAGWDPKRDVPIEPGDPIPEKPWVCTLFHIVCGQGHGRVTHAISSPPLFVTHHSLSRSAQRWGVRTAEDLSAVIETITDVAFAYLIEIGGVAQINTPPEGVRLPMSENNATVIVVEKHETRQALVVSTVLD
jgi:hypothetical protein